MAYARPRSALLYRRATTRPGSRALLWVGMGTVDSDHKGQAAPTPMAAHFILPVLACGLVIYYFTTTLDLVWEAKATGIFVGAILMAMCIVHMVRMGLEIAAGRGSLSFGELLDNTLFNRQRLALLGLVALFIGTLQWVGTTLGLFLLILGSMLVMGVRSIRALVGVALVTAATVYTLLIYLLGSRLPQGPAEQLIAWLLSLAGAG